MSRFPAKAPVNHDASPRHFAMLFAQRVTAQIIELVEGKGG
jgi:hypothetical protein